MPNAYEHVRKFPLNVVLAALGFDTFKYRKAGTEGYGACPIHGSKKNTTCFSFNDDGKWNCFSCGKHGRGAIDLTMAIRNVGFKDAVAALQELPAAVQPLPTPPAKCQESPPSCTPVSVPEQVREQVAENQPFRASYEKYFRPHPWLEARGLTSETLARYEVGYYENPARRSAYSGSVMLKIRRWSDSEPVAYLVRNIGEVTAEKPKYRFPPKFQKSLELFGAEQLRQGQTLPLRVCYLLESPFAVMKFSQFGFPAVSCFGWSVSEQQAAILARLAKGYIYLPDADKANSIASSLLTLSRVCWVKSPAINVSDPELLSREEILALT